MIASLPMYMRPENEEAYIRFWQIIRSELTCLNNVPKYLSKADGIDHWKNPDLVFSQTCGMPYRLHLKDHVQLIGTPDYGLMNCPPGYYYSILIANKNDPRGSLADFSLAKLAVNSTISQSGYAAPQTEAHKLGFRFANLILTGAHINSAKHVATGDADIAAIDAVSWSDIQRYDTFSSDLKVVGHTDPTPGLPYICAKGMDCVAITKAVETAIGRLAPKDRGILGIQSLISIPKSAYLAVQNP